MKSLTLLTAIILVSSIQAQYEAGFVKIIEDQRYQDGARFGNLRHQEDGIKYQEETDATGVRRGSWEYPDETGKIVRVQFIAGPGIGFRIVSSNVVAPTPIVASKSGIAPLPIVRQSRPIPARVVVQPEPVQARVVVQPEPVQARVVVQPKPIQAPVLLLPEPAPKPQNIFDYPADLQFFRDANGHRFRFAAV